MSDHGSPRGETLKTPRSRHGHNTGVTDDHPNLIRADLHNHTHFSPDSILSPEYLVRRARERGIDVIAVTDHDTIEGGLRCRELAADEAPELRVIVGEEVRTKDGEILGLFLTEEIPRDLSAEETVYRIHGQNALAGAPHPFDAFRSGLKPEAMVDIVGQLDFIEGLNARMMFSRHNQHAQQLAAEYGKPMTAASDAHSAREVGRAYVEMPDFASPLEFLESLHAGRLIGGTSWPFVHWISRYAVLRRKLGWKPRPA